MISLTVKSLQVFFFSVLLLTISFNTVAENPLSAEERLSKQQLLKSHLVLDHINFSFEEKTFEKLKQLEGLFEQARFSAVKTKQLEYDLVGIMLRDGSYVELLNRTKAVADSGFEMAVIWCSSDPDITDVNLLPTLYPEIEWSGRSATHLDGREWYKTVQQTPLRTPYTTWGMYYYDRSKYRVVDYRINPPDMPFTFSEWVEGRARIPEALAADIIRTGFWFPNPPERINDQIHLRIPTPNGKIMDLYLQIDDKVAKTTLDSFSLRMLEPKEPTAVEGLGFSLKGDVLTVSIEKD